MKKAAACVLAGFVAHAALAGFAAPDAQAQAVYRCGSAYSDEPCVNGRIVDVSDSRSAEQRDAAREVITRDRRLATEMQQDRRLQAASVKPSAAASLSGKLPGVVNTTPHAMKPQRRKRHRYTALQDDDFIAVAPGTSGKAKKASGR